MKKVYIVIQPDGSGTIYDRWEECRAAVSGKPGLRYQSVSSREKAEAMLSGGVVLPPGTWAFTDGNAAGGVGIVLVEQRDAGPPTVQETSMSVHEVVADGDVPGLGSAADVTDALGKLHNILAEMAALYQALRTAPLGSQFTVVYDYKGVAEWLGDRWKARGSVEKAIVEACRGVLRERRLTVSFQHQPGHQSDWAARDDFAQWNARADALATMAAKGRKVRAERPMGV